MCIKGLLLNIVFKIRFYFPVLNRTFNDEF